MADAYAQDVSTLAVSESLQDVAEVTDPNARMNVLRTRYGSATDALVDDARRAVASLRPQVRDFLEQTGAGNSPGVIAALAQWHRGGFKLSPTEARAKLAQGVKDPLEARLLHMRASREG